MLRDTLPFFSFFFLMYAAAGTRVKRETWQRECNLDKKERRVRKDRERERRKLSSNAIFLKMFRKTSLSIFHDLESCNISAPSRYLSISKKRDER